MMRIADAISGKAILPLNFFAKKYDRFLFFDISLRDGERFFDELQRSVAKDSIVLIFYSNQFEPLGFLSCKEKWSDKITQISRELEIKREFFSFTLLESEGDWVIAQNYPVDLGVFAFDSHKENSVKFFSNLDKRWFLTIEDFELALDNKNSNLYNYFDISFMKNLVLNYRS